MKHLVIYIKKHVNIMKDLSTQQYNVRDHFRGKADIKKLKHTKGKAGTSLYGGHGRQLELFFLPVAKEDIFNSNTTL